MPESSSIFSIQNLNFYYGAKRALSGISMEVEPRKVTALIGPSGCGKSTFLRCLNRMNDTIAGTRVEGKILLNGDDIYAPGMDVVDLRQRVGMVFQNPTRSRSPFTTMLPSVRASSAIRGRNRNWTNWWRPACAAPRCGTT